MYHYVVGLLSFILATDVYADSIDKEVEGFDDVSTASVQTASGTKDTALDGFNDGNISEGEETKESIVEGLTGKLTQQLAYAYNGIKPHDHITSFKTFVLLDYEHKFENGWRLKTNSKWHYDAVYDLRDVYYSDDELKEQRHEAELFDAYIEGSITENIDLRLGRQVVVWGRSDTIRITDVLNPLDNRRPGMVDIEDLRLPVSMAKFDFFWGNWRITPIAVLEQRFSKMPAFGSAFNPQPDPHISKEKYSDITYALSVGGEFSGWDVNFYAARLRNDAGYVKLRGKPILIHDKNNMFGMALNILSGSWLFKTELAYFNGLKYAMTQNKSFSRMDALVGVEYKGIADTMISYDLSVRHFTSYDKRLEEELFPTEENTYQHAFRISRDFMHATLTANYLISLYGKKLDKGGFQRAWIKYELGEGINTHIGIVDYIGGSGFFDSIKKNDTVFTDISYSF